MFFKKNKISFDAKKPNQIKNALNIICPNCNNEQIEPKMALSTNCKKCTTYFKIVKGKAVPPTDRGFYKNNETTNSVGSIQPEATVKKEAPSEEEKQVHLPEGKATSDNPSPVKAEEIKPLSITTGATASVKSPAIPPSAIKSEVTPAIKESLSTALPMEEKAPPLIEKKSVQPIAAQEKNSKSKNSPVPIPDKESQENIIEQAPKRYVPAQSQTEATASSTGLFGKGKAKSAIKQRDVSCFDCDRIHQAPMGASSTNCPQCGTYITLKDFDIRGPSNVRIQTRGNVVIHKKASVTGITIHCHDLTVTGQFTGGVNCSGDLILDSHGKLMGEVKCKRLIIEKRADIEFASHVYAEEIVIDGTAIGNFTCSGKLQLKKKATLTGDISVKTMTMEEGAKHNGRMSIGQ